MTSPVLDSIFGPIPEHVLRTEPIDISACSNQEPGSKVLTFREPSAVLRFQSADDGKKLGKSRIGWTESLGTSVALLSRCHEGLTPPDGKAKADVYIELVEKHGDTFLFILEKFGELFPTKDAADALKEASDFLNPARSKASSSAPA